MAGEAAAQMGGVRGRVLDEEGNPLEAVEISLVPSGGGRTYTTETDDKGSFVKGGLRVGQYVIQYDFDGYEQVKGPVAVSFGKPIYLDDVTLAKLAAGVLTEKTAARAQEHLDAAMAASSSEDHQATIDALKEFIEMVPDSAEAHFNIGAAYEKMGDKENAVASYRKAVEFAPDMYAAWLAIGDIRGSERNWQEGMEALGKALELRPDTGTVLFNYGAYAFNAGDVELAKTAFAELVEANPNHALGHYQLGLVFVGQGNNEEAILHLEKYLELEPEGGNAAGANQLLQTLKQS